MLNNYTMDKVDILAFKAYSYDTDSFAKDILEYSKNSILLVSYQFDKIVFYYYPSDIKFKNKEIKFWRSRFKSDKLTYYLSPLILTMNIVLYFKLFIILCYKYRPKICWSENTYVALIVGCLRRLGFCGKSLYLPGDWIAVGNDKKRLLKYICNNLFFPLIDYLACKLNDTVINHTEEIAKARFKFWGRKIAKNEKLYEYKLQIKTDNISNERKKQAFCFIGDMRSDSGIDIAISALSEVRNKQDFTFKVIGPQRQNCDYFKCIAEKLKVSENVHFLGFIDTDKLPQVLADCFCGISLVTTKNSYSAYTIPGKLVHYLQYLLPVIVTEGAGAIVSVIRKNDLGLVIEPSKDAFINAIFTIYDNQKRYRQNIVSYINSLQKIDLKELIEA